MENVKKKSYFKENLKEVIVGGIIFIAVIFGVVILLSGNNNKPSENTGNNDNNVENNIDNDKDDDKESITVTEKDIIDVYGLSKDDAKNLVMKAFNSDNFEYEVIVNNNAKYIVTVTNTISNTVYKFEVDPATKTYVEI